MDPADLLYHIKQDQQLINRLYMYNDMLGNFEKLTVNKKSNNSAINAPGPVGAPGVTGPPGVTGAPGVCCNPEQPKPVYQKPHSTEGIDMKEMHFDIIVKRDNNMVCTLKGYLYDELLTMLNSLVNKYDYKDIKIDVRNPKHKSSGDMMNVGSLKFNLDGSKLVPDLSENGIFQLGLLNSVIETPMIHYKLRSKQNPESNNYLAIHNGNCQKGTLNEIKEFLNSVPLPNLCEVSICDLNDTIVYKLDYDSMNFESKNGNSLPDDFLNAYYKKVCRDQLVMSIVD